MLANAAKMAADFKWCVSCQKAGVKSRIRLMQINLEEAAVLCENKQCTSNSTSAMILPRSVSKLASYKRKKQRQNLPSPAGNPPASPMPPSPKDSSHDHLVNGIPGSTNSGTIPSPQLRTQLWEEKVVQWKNKDALCWLDVSMCALVHCTSLRSCLQRQCDESLLLELCREFDRAQVVGETDGPVGEQAKQLHQWTNHDRLCNGQNGSTAEDKQGKVGGGQPGKTSPESNSNDLQQAQSMQCSLQSSLDNLGAEAALEWLVMSDEESTKQQKNLLVASKANQQLKDSPTSSASTTQDAASILESIREKIWKALELKLDCKLGKEETPVFALPLLACLSGAVEEHFLARYRWEFYCRVCKHTDIKLCKKAVTSLTTLATNFCLSSPAIVRTCPACNSPGQTSQLIYHSLPACMMFHFSQGVQDPDVMSYNIKTDTCRYEVSCIIQYISNPNHFIAWIRDVQRNMWLKCNDLDSPVCEWQMQPPSIPASEIHIVMLERQGGEPCTECDAMNSSMTKIRSTVDQLVEKRASSNVASARKSVASVVRNSQSSSSAGSSLGVSGYLRQKKASSFQSYSSASRDQMANHVQVIDLDAYDEGSCETPSGGPEENGLAPCNGVKGDKSWSRSSSPVTVSSTHTRKRSLPNYLLSADNHSRNRRNDRSNGMNKIALTERTKRQNYSKFEDKSSGNSSNGQLQSSAISIQFGNNNVYTKKLRAKRHSPMGGLNYRRKTLYPSYSETQAHQSSNDRPVTVPTLAASLPEGAFVRYSVWRKRSSNPNSLSDRSTVSSPSELTLDSSSLLALSNTTRPRCDSLSSVSSPSACSDLSSFSDNTSVCSNKDDLGSTIEELYKALEISGETSRLDSRIPSPTLDDEFLAEILADDPVPTALPSTGESGISRNSSGCEPSVDKAALVAGSQELDCIVPSIEPMGQELLAKLVV